AILHSTKDHQRLLGLLDHLLSSSPLSAQLISLNEKPLSRDPLLVLRRGCLYLQPHLVFPGQRGQADGADCEPIIPARRRRLRERLQSASAGEVDLDDLLTVRSDERHGHVNGFLLHHDTQKLPRRERDLISMRLTARNFALKRFTGFKRRDLLRLRRNKQKNCHNEKTPNLSEHTYLQLPIRMNGAQ